MTDKVNILCLYNSFTEEQVQELCQLSEIDKYKGEVEIVIPDREEMTEEELRAEYEKAEVIWGLPDKDWLSLAENLQWLQLITAGLNGYDQPELYFGEVTLCNATGAYGPAIAEHILALILGFNRQLHTFIRQQERNEWERTSIKRDFSGSTTTVLGLGDLGDSFARKAHLLGSKVLAVKNTLFPEPEYVDQLYQTKELDRVLKKADNVVLTLPLTEKTRGIIGRRELKLMGEEALLVNVGRGPLIQKEALLEALSNDWIAGAALDVTDPEPLPEDSPLWDFDNVIITPHNAGFAPSIKQGYLQLFKENLRRFLQNKELINKVDFTAGY